MGTDREQPTHWLPTQQSNNRSRPIRSPLSLFSTSPCPRRRSLKGALQRPRSESRTAHCCTDRRLLAPAGWHLLNAGRMASLNLHFQTLNNLEGQRYKKAESSNKEKVQDRPESMRVHTGPRLVKPVVGSGFPAFSPPHSPVSLCSSTS